jgi:hypothetical protein
MSLAVCLEFRHKNSKSSLKIYSITAIEIANEKKKRLLGLKPAPIGTLARFPNC